MKRVFVVCAVLLAAPAVLAQSAPWLRGFYGGGVAQLNWPAVSGATQYLVQRADVYPSWNHTYVVQSITSYGEMVSANTAYVYRVQPQNSAAQNVGPPTNLVVVTTYGFPTDPTPSTSNPPPVKFLHVNELRTSINAARIAAGLTAATWSHPTLDSTSSITVADFAEMRTALDAALTALVLQPPSYTDPTLYAGTTPIRLIHLMQLRTRAQAFPRIVVGSLGASNRYFSPNADGQKDTTLLSGTAGSDPLLRWAINIRNSSGTAIRSTSGSGTAVAFVWDGRNDGGVMQPEGDYTAELVDLDTIAAPIASTVITIDNTAPQGAITQPTAGQTLSNIKQNGSGDFAVLGTSTDAHFANWTLEVLSNNQVIATLGQASTPVNPAGLLGTWQTIVNGTPVANGSYTLRLTSNDQAGNSQVASTQVTLGHFTASQNVYEINTVNSATITYTSNIPYTVTETLTIKSALTGATVRTLVNAQRAAGSYADVWDGRNDQGQVVPDGPYRYYVTLNDGTYSYTWDQSAQFIGNVVTQYSYPKCRVGTGNNASYVECNDSSVVFDPFDNKPLYINYCNYDPPLSGTFYPTCTASAPMLVEAKVSSSTGEAPTVCDSTCFYSAFQSSGQHEIIWYGYSLANQFVANLTNLLVVRRNNSFPRNMVIVFGNAPAITGVTATPPLFDPWWGTQTFTVAATAVGGRPLTYTASFKNAASGSTLRTMTSTTNAITWNGRADNGEYVAPGTYLVTITVTDSLGNSAVVNPLSTVRY